MKGDRIYRKALEDGTITIGSGDEHTELLLRYCDYCRHKGWPLVVATKKTTTVLVEVDLTHTRYTFGRQQPLLAHVLAEAAYSKSIKTAKRPFIRVGKEYAVAENILLSKLTELLEEIKAVLFFVYRDATARMDAKPRLPYVAAVAEDLIKTYPPFMYGPMDSTMVKRLEKQLADGTTPPKPDSQK